MAHEVSLGHGLAALPGWAAVGTGASQLCQVSCGRKGIAIETDVDDEPWWATGWEWRYLESVQVTTDADGAVLVLKDRGPKSMSIRLLDLDAQQVEAAIEPHRSLIDSAPPPPSVEELQELLREPVDDLDFQPHEGGIEIWFSDIVAHDDNDLVDD